MKKVFKITLLFFIVFSAIISAQEKINKVNEDSLKSKLNSTQAINDQILFKNETGNSILSITDEGNNAGSVTLPPLSSIGSSSNKLYNIGGSLYWNGSALSSVGSAGGWTHTGSVIYNTTLTDKVGIGITNPDVNLDIRSSAVEQAATLRVANTDMSHNIFFSSGANSINPQISFIDGDDLRFRKWDGSTSTELMRIKSNGNVGIGTDAPGAKLEVNGRLLINGGNGSNQHDRIKLYFYGANLGHSLGTEDFHNTYGPDPQYVNTVGHKFYVHGDELAAQIGFGGWGTPENRTNSIFYGNIGIGINNPTEKLQVNGIISSTNGGIKFPDGSVQISAANGSGNTLDQAYDQGGVGVGRVITADAGAFEVDGVDGVLFRGIFNEGTIPQEGTGVRMMWYPAKIAFRAGGITEVGGNDAWNDENIGYYSNALGQNPLASGDYSTAIGSNSTASGRHSTAIGNIARAIGDYSTAMGTTTTANGDYSTAMGESTGAKGNYSTAFGSYSIASGRYSTAMGTITTASGYASTAMGLSTKAESMCSTAMGQHNVGGGNPENWEDNDPILEIGIGSPDVNANAVTVLKNGRTGLGSSAIVPENVLEVNGHGTSAGGIDGFPEVVARLRNSTSGQHTALSIQAQEGTDPLIWFYEENGARWNLRSDASDAGKFQLRYRDLQGTVSSHMTITTDGDVGIGTTNPQNYKLYVNGTAYSTGGWQSSDVRYKKDIKDISGALDKINQLRGVSYKFRNEQYPEKGFPEGKHFGVIAQEIEKVLPEIVKDGPDRSKAVAYTEIIPILIEAIKAQQSIIEELTKRIEKLEKQK